MFFLKSAQVLLQFEWRIYDWVDDQGKAKPLNLEMAASTLA